MSRAVSARVPGESIGAAPKSSPAAKSTPAPRSAPKGYFCRSALPLASLVFLLPFIILYEIGTRRFTIDPVSHAEIHIIAFKLLKEFFGFLGASGRYLPALAVVGILLAWHIARNDAWKISVTTLAGMAFESIVLAMPLLLFGFALARHLPLIGVNAAWRSNVVLSLGAGIYEELIFRLIGFTLFHMLFRDVLILSKGWSYLFMVVTSAVLFSMYHYLGNETFALRSFVFRTIAGCYFGVVFLTRGFGVTAGSHMVYDIITTSLQVLRA